MGVTTQVELARKRGVSQVHDLLGITEPSVEKLLDAARAVLGDKRTGRCHELIRVVPLSRRADAASSIASLLVGARTLDPEWWTRPHAEMELDGSWVERGIPEDVLATEQFDRNEYEYCLQCLCYWVEDDAADARWGRPIDYVDLNCSDRDDRVRLPENASAGDRFIATSGPGARIWVDVIEREQAASVAAERNGTRRGRLGTVLGERMYHDAAHVEWAWGMATDTGPIRLPGEVAGADTDPFTRELEHDTAHRLFAWAKEHGATAEELGSPWRTKADLWTAYFRIWMPGRPGAWHGFGKAMIAAVDDGVQLASMIEDLK